MKTIVKIQNDNFGDLASETYKENINYLVNELNVFCELKDNYYINIVEQEKRYSSDKNDYKNKIVIEAKGYSQSDWQTYVLHYNENELKTSQERMYFSDLVKQLERSFTHQNDYFVEKFERTTIDGKEFNSDPHDVTTFCILHTEFPNKEAVLKEYIEIYGIDYDEAIIDIE